MNRNMSEDARKSFVSVAEDLIASIEYGIARVKTGSDLEKGYLLEKIENLKNLVNRSL